MTESAVEAAANAMLALERENNRPSHLDYARVAVAAAYPLLVAEIERLHASSDEMLAVLNAARIMLKNRDQRPDEMKLLDAIKMVIANAEGVP